MFDENKNGQTGQSSDEPTTPPQYAAPSESTSYGAGFGASAGSGAGFGAGSGTGAGSGASAGSGTSAGAGSDTGAGAGSGTGAGSGESRTDHGTDAGFGASDRTSYGENAGSSAGQGANPNQYQYRPPYQAPYQNPFQSSQGQGQSPYGQYGGSPYGQQPSGAGGFPPSSTPPPPAGGQRQEEYRWNFEDYQAVSSDKKPKRNRGLTVFAGLLSVVLAVGVVWLSGYGVYSLITEKTAETTPGTESPSSQSQTAELMIKDRPTNLENSSVASSEGGMSTVDIAKKVKPSVVSITNYSAYNSFNPSGTGSGIIMSQDGYILTNAHVVQNAIGINVTLYNDESYAAQLIGIDARTDLAVIKIQADNLTSAEFGNSGVLEVGERVVAIGNPAGSVLAGSVTQGIVSGLDRMIKDNSYSVNYIQVDAAINPGNSGGALVNSYGQVIGINSAKLSSVDYEGIGFAIPINDAKPIVDDLINNGYVTGRCKIGIRGGTVDAGLAQINRIPTGVIISTIEPTSDLAGKQVAPGDIITHIDGTRIEKMENITAFLEGKKPDDTITMSMYRPTQNGNGKTYDVTVRLMADVDQTAGNPK